MINSLNKNRETNGKIKERKKTKTKTKTTPKFIEDESVTVCKTLFYYTLCTKCNTKTL